MRDMVNPWHFVSGNAETGGTLVIGDHASGVVPPDVNLDIAARHMKSHIALDIGTENVARYLNTDFGFALHLAAWSRLVVDLNRHRDDPAAIVRVSDGVDIPGNVLTDTERETRLSQYYDRYHKGLEQTITALAPDFLLFLHSYTPTLGTDAITQRPWHLGVMYDRDDRAANIALDYLETTGLVVGDQLPYSGKVYNSALHRHGDMRGLPYIGLEVRNDMIDTAAGQGEFAQIIGNMCQKITQTLASEPSPRNEQDNPPHI